MLRSHSACRSQVSSKIKESIFAVFGETLLDPINTNATPQAIAAWKSSRKTKLCFKKLFAPIENDPNDTYFTRILSRAWPTAASTNMQLAYIATVCQIMLNEHYEKLTMSDEISKNRLNKNIVSKYLIIIITLKLVLTNFI